MPSGAALSPVFAIFRLKMPQSAPSLSKNYGFQLRD